MEKTEEMSSFYSIENIGKLFSVATAVVCSFVAYFRHEYAEECAKFYGINMKLFSENLFGENCIEIIIIVFAIWILPWFVMGQKNKKWWEYIYIAILLFTQCWLWCGSLTLIVGGDTYVFVAFFVVAIILCCIVVLKDYYDKNSSTDKTGMKNVACKYGKVAFVVLVAGYSVVFYQARESMRVSNVDKYDMIGEKYVSVAEYNGKNVLMECNVIEKDNRKILQIRKNRYKLKNVDDVDIDTTTFSAVEIVDVLESDK